MAQVQAEIDRRAEEQEKEEDKKQEALRSATEALDSFVTVGCFYNRSC
jgi:hypothetical protein